MPVLVGIINSPTYQDQEDLQKIYRDAPQWLFSPFTDAAQLIETTLSDGTLLAGRFNDRLLGAARLEQTGDVWRLSHLCVRALTRRRGVAERLVAHAQKSARHAGCELRLQTTAELPEVLALAAKLKVPLEIARI
ncbi:hypothetical protein PSCICL_39300 [Pseudomonas cichorii]|nr:hypothetical protein PSCICL_39300 [Pseudomonas cichorii]